MESALNTSQTQQAWLTTRLTPHPFGTFNSPLNLKNKIANGLPATYIIGPDGAIRYRHLGELDWSSPEVRELILKLLK